MHLSQREVVRREPQTKAKKPSNQASQFAPSKANSKEAKEMSVSTRQMQMRRTGSDSISFVRGSIFYLPSSGLGS
jgi:hypothetical protein